MSKKEYLFYNELDNRIIVPSPPKLKQYPNHDKKIQHKIKRQPTKSVSRERIFKKFNFQCVICGSVQFLTIDHKIPLSKGGTNSHSNKQCMCFYCNQKKGNRLISNEDLKKLINQQIGQ